MRNKRFPNYPDDTDYTTNAPSYYDDLARKEKLIRLLAERIWGYEEILDETLEQIQERFRAWDKNLEDFPEDVKILLQQWLDNGTLDHIINDTIFNWKLDTTIFEQFELSTNQQLAQTPFFIMARSQEGTTGGEKIQNALDTVRPEGTQKIVFVDALGPDQNNIWLLNNSLKISANTTLILNGSYLKLADGANQNILENKHFDTGDDNISIIMNGNACLDCNRKGQLYGGALPYQKLGVFFYNIKNFNFKGLKIKDPYRQILVLEKAHNGIIDDVYFDTEGRINQDGLHIIGPASDIIATRIRGIVGDDALVANARTNPVQGYGTGGDVENITFDNVIISGSNNAEIDSHVGLLRTAPGELYKVKNITLSNAIGHNLKESLARFGGNEVAPINHHVNVSLINVKGYEGTSGPISLFYQRTPIKNTKISMAHIETVKSYLINNNGHAVHGLQLSNITRKMTGTYLATDHLSTFLLTGADIKDIQVSDFKDDDENNVIENLFNFQGSTVTNVTGSNIIARNTSRYIRTSGGTTNNIRLNDVSVEKTDDTAYVGISGDQDVIINKYATETSGLESLTPTRQNYQVGDVVLYRPQSGIPFSLFLKDHANRWYKINNDV